LHNDLIQQLKEWEAKVPTSLHWGKPANDRSPLWLKMQRIRLESQYHCLAMRINWTIALLNTNRTASLQALGNLEDTYTHCRDHALKVVQLSNDSVDLNADAHQFYHADAIRATKQLLHIPLRHVRIQPEQLDKCISYFQQGLTTSRSLVPKVLTRAEDRFEQLLQEYVQFWLR
jgi:hypothetical protein